MSGATNPAIHFFFEAKPRLAAKVGAGGVASAVATTIPHTFVGLTEGNAYVVSVNRTNATGTTKNPANETETFIGKVSGTNFIDCVRQVEGVAQAWAADTVLEILVSATVFNKLVEGLEVEHNQTGTHKSALVTTLKASGAEVTTGTEDAKIVTPKAIADAGIVKDTDITLAANSDNKVSSQKAVKTYVDTQISGINLAEDGWTSVSDSWVYASATTITVPSGAASRYQVGDRVKLTQSSTVKYFVVVGVADTLLTVTGGSDYILANSAISAISYSHSESPVGFPYWFAYTPTGPTNTTLTGRFRVSGREVHCIIRGTVTGSPSFTNMPTVPVPNGANAIYDINTANPCGVGGYLDNGAANRGYGMAPVFLQANDVIRLVNTDVAGDRTVVDSTHPITWANGDIWYVNFFYEI